MKIPGAKRQGPFSERGLYGACLLLLTGLGMLLLHLLNHRSITPAILDRYSVKFALVLAGVLLMFMVSGCFIVANWRRLPERFAWVKKGYERKPGVWASLLAAGVAFVGLAVFFHALIALFFPPFPFVGSVAVVYSGVAGLIFSAVTRRQAVSLGRRVLLILVGLFIGFALGEAGLRIATQSTPYRILPAGMQAAFHPAPDVMPGIDGVSVYTTNEVGMRGDPYKPEGRYSMLTIGGSTTECAYLDNTEAWPYLLQQNLNRRGHTSPVWVGNVGRSGHGLVEHIHALRYFVPQFEFDAVIVMAGINDLAPAWWDPEQYAAWADPNNFSHHLYRSFYTKPLVDAAIPRPFPENLAVWNLVELGFWKIYHSLDDLGIEDLAGLNYERRRQQYRNAPVRAGDIPGLSTALERYKENLRVLIQTAGAHGVRLILTTQPVLWSDHLSAEAEGLLWFGLARSSEPFRYAQDTLARAMHRFNEGLLEVCRATNTECIDLAAAMNGDERYFYDDVHFNEQGARTVAGLIAEYLERSGF